MAGRKRQPAPQSSKDERRVTTGRQPQRPGQDARFQEKPGVRDDEKVASAAPERVLPPPAPPPSAPSITKKR